MENRKLKKGLQQLPIKIWCILAAFLLSAYFAPAALAAGGTIIAECSKHEVTPGESFDVVVSLDQTDGMAGYLIYVFGDTTVFTASMDEEDGTCLVQKGNFTTSGTIMANTFDEGWQILWFAPKNVSGSGTLFTITLTVNEHAANGEYEIGVGYSPENTIDIDANPCVFFTKGDTIWISGQEENGGTDGGEIKEDAEATKEEDESEAEEQKDNGVNFAQESSEYIDLPKSNWAYPYVTRLTERGIVSGSGDGMFHPDASVTRAEFVKMLVGVAGVDTVGLTTAKFTDVTSRDWFMPYVSWAHQEGIVNGINETEFGPQALLTREQMAALIVRLCNKMGVQLPMDQEAINFIDADQISLYARNAVSSVQKSGVINGYPDGSFMPKANTKRSEAAKVLATIMEFIDAQQ